MTANAVHPGVVNTELGRFRENLSLPARILMTLSYNVMKHFIKTASRGAQTSIYVAVSPELENVTGKYFRYRYMVFFSRYFYRDEIRLMVGEHMKNDDILLVNKIY